MAVTLTTAQAKLDYWIAEQSKPPSYSVGDRTVTRASQTEIRSNIAFWSREVARLTAIAAGNSTNPGYLTPRWR